MTSDSNVSSLSPGWVSMNRHVSPVSVTVPETFRQHAGRRSRRGGFGRSRRACIGDEEQPSRISAPLRVGHVMGDLADRSVVPRKSLSDAPTSSPRMPNSTWMPGDWMSASMTPTREPRWAERGRRFGSRIRFAVHHETSARRRSIAADTDHPSSEIPGGERCAAGYRTPPPSGTSSPPQCRKWRIPSGASLHRQRRPATTTSASLNGAARLDEGAHAGRRGDTSTASGNGKKASDAQTAPAGTSGRERQGLVDGLAGGVDPAHLPEPQADEATIFHEDDGVARDTSTEAPGEVEIGLARGQSASRVVTAARRPGHRGGYRGPSPGPRGRPSGSTPSGRDG